ncbi:MAG: hypothetical protein LRZ84_22700, partial [Desertifilum sp.]|nr:hypothetical protein [Desertifilum sp.]
LRLIVDEQQYSRLVKLRSQSLNVSSDLLLKTSFFPSYRCSVTALKEREQYSDRTLSGVENVPIFR